MITKRIKSLREKKGLTLKALAEELGLNVGTLSTYERGTREPSISTIKLLANYFDVTSDYLIGISKIKNKDEKIQFDENFETLKKYLDFFPEEILLDITEDLNNFFNHCNFHVGGTVFDNTYEIVKKINSISTKFEYTWATLNTAFNKSLEDLPEEIKECDELLKFFKHLIDNKDKQKAKELYIKDFKAKAYEDITQIFINANELITLMEKYLTETFENREV